MGTLVNAIKAIFASKKTTDSNYAVPLLNKNDASPAGYMELPDLAAVAAGANMLARLLDFRVLEAVSGDLNNMKTGMVYVADKGKLTNEPAEMDDGPCAYFFFGKIYMDRGVQVCFHVSNANGVAKIFMRGQLYSGWSAWKSITLS